MNGFLHAVRHAARFLFKSPAHTVAAALLALRRE
jgi:hypothetical protein